MTRQKKSRKIGQIGTRKQETRPTDTNTPRRKKAPKGQKSGNRNSLLEEKTNIQGSASGPDKKNSKLGSKKKIALVKTQAAKAPEPKEIKHSTSKPQVKLTKVLADALTPEQELAQLEADTRLLELAERAEQGELLTGKDAKYFNQKMNRYDELVELLGLEPEQEEADPLSQLGADQWDDLMSDKD